MGQTATRLGKGAGKRNHGHANGNSTENGNGGVNNDEDASLSVRIQEFQDAFLKKFGRDDPAIDVFVEFYRSALPENQSNPLSKHLMRQLHRQKDRVRLHDITSLIEVLENGSDQDKVELLFSLFDLDGNGRIDEIEFLQIVRDSYTYTRRFSPNQSGKMPVPADERIRFTFNTTDINSDGVLSKKEFVEACSVNRDVCDMALTCLRDLLRELISKL